jgi:hypothetical protein
MILCFYWQEPETFKENLTQKKMKIQAGYSQQIMVNEYDGLWLMVSITRKVGFGSNNVGLSIHPNKTIFASDPDRPIDLYDTPHL